MIACPICGAKTAVIETRATRTSARRRRRCIVKSCAGRVTTIEVAVTEGQVSAIVKGGAVVALKHLTALQEVVAALVGGAV